MSRSCSSIALLLGALSNSIVFALMPSTEQPSPASRHLKRASSPFDHSDIKHYAAIGDSFAAGLGAGTRLTGWGDWYCSRYDNAYPVLINTNPALGDSSGRKFDFWACSGAVTTDVVNKQIPSLDKPDMVTLSIGGNDANLKDILHACVFQWNKDPSLDCDKILSDTQAVIDNPTFAKNFDDVLNALKPKMASADSKIYWTGYSRFWDTSTNECDSVTWAFKYNIPNRQYLTQARRQKMNDLTDAVNQKIQDAIGRAGNQVIFVPWEGDIDFITGHFCEPGVNEWIGEDREQTAFYEWGSTLDDNSDIQDKDELKKRQAPGVLSPGQNLNDTFEGAITAWILEAMQKDKSITPADLNMTSEDVVHAQSGLLLPDKYGRIFHPQKFGHAMISESILRTMDDVKAKSMGQKAATTTLIGCPAPTGPASHPGEHNQCYSDSPSSDQATFALDAGDGAIHDFCLKHKGDTVVVGDGILDTVPNGGDKSSGLILRASLDTTPPCQNYPNIGQWNFFDCVGEFGRAMNDCDTGTTSAKKGGDRTADCITYSIRASKSASTKTTKAPYAEGNCSLHLTQYASIHGPLVPFNPSSPPPLDYQVELKIYDNSKTQIGNQDKADAGAGNSLQMKSKLQDLLVITPEEQNDYIQFALGSEQFASSGAQCRVGGWDPKQFYPHVSLSSIGPLTPRGANPVASLGVTPEPSQRAPGGGD